MKKYFYSLFAAAALILSATSCSQEDDFAGGNGETVNVSFNVSTGDVAAATRAIGTDGNNNSVNVGGGNLANNLIYAVYESGKYEEALIQKKAAEAEDGKFNVTVPLVKGIEYDIVFLAYNEAGNAFSITAGNAETTDLTALKLNQSLLTNQEAYDAFFNVKKSYKASASTEKVTLYRPFAQLNVGTTDTDLTAAADLDVVVNQSKVVIKNVPTTFNALTGEVSEPAEVTFDAADILKHYENGATDQNEEFSVNGKDEQYNYLALAYVLAEGEKSTHDTEITFYRGEADEINTLYVSNLPLQRNYRTNIIGNMLTSQ